MPVLFMELIEVSRNMELYSKGNEAFIDEDYEKAAQLYSEAIEQDGNNSDFYSNRSQTYVKLQKYTDALADSMKAIELDNKNTKAYLRKGIAQFHLKEYRAAKDSLQAGQAVDASETNFTTWLEKCEKELTATVDSSSASTSKSQPTPIMPSGPKTRYDWYQTETHVVLTIMLKKVKQEDLTVNVQSKSLGVFVKLPGGNDYSLELDLLHEIDSERSVTKILSTKIEIKLPKKEGVRWTALEGEEDSTIKHFQPEVNKYPSSSHYTRNWDKLAQEVTEEEKKNLEGDAALNNLFQQIYADGNDETRKAMNKSFQESGGTVLSTNWSEIGTKKTDIKPPDGMEYKNWDQ